MSAEEAKAYGLVDEVVKSRKEIKTAADLVEQSSSENKNP
jgi:enoyl-CoA hydratase/carnithine racemase